MDEMDPCECIWSHELAMRRLMSMLRQGQAYCTDTECIDELALNGESGSMREGGGGTGVDPFAPSEQTLMFCMMLAVAALMYLFRPNAGRSGSAAAGQEDAGLLKTGGGVNRDTDRNGPPPPPPPAVN